MKSRITGGATAEIFTATVLGRYQVRYFRCEETGFIQTEDPFWLPEAYASVISPLDVGYVSRNLSCRDFTEQVLLAVRPDAGPCLDYGGGYGLFVRLMRDLGFDFYREDPHCENLFAGGFDVPVGLGEASSKFDVATAFEVLEHVDDPLATLEVLLNRTDLIVFSTELQPESLDLQSADDWWYFMPKSGQHVSFYNRQTLSWMANKFGVSFYTDDRSRHIFSRDPLPLNPFTRPRQSVVRRAMKHAFPFALPYSAAKTARMARRVSLLAEDFQRALRNFDREA